ncbi:MAG: dihydrofolate reductase [Saprospiraceae bacterium]|nr:dihydrofolate reductase [Saprospiraceae bacterium]
MTISCIVAVARHNVFGKNNEIPWYLPADLAYFKKTTLNHCIIMGRSCFDSIGRPLPNRTNIIITRDPFFIASQCLVAHSIGEALAIAQQQGDDEIFIIGGGQIYEQTQDLWQKIYLTEVDLEVEGDTFFPEIDQKMWQLLSEESHEKNEKNPFNYTFKILEKI